MSWDLTRLSTAAAVNRQIASRKTSRCLVSDSRDISSTVSTSATPHHDLASLHGPSLLIIVLAQLAELSYKLVKIMKGKKERKSIYIALFYQASQSAQTWITQFYLQITPCLTKSCLLWQRLAYRVTKSWWLAVSESSVKQWILPPESLIERPEVVYEKDSRQNSCC